MEKRSRCAERPIYHGMFRDSRRKPGCCWHIKGGCFSSHTGSMFVHCATYKRKCSGFRRITENYSRCSLGYLLAAFDSYGSKVVGRDATIYQRRVDTRTQNIRDTLSFLHLLQHPRPSLRIGPTPSYLHSKLFLPGLGISVQPHTAREAASLTTHRQRSAPGRDKVRRRWLTIRKPNAVIPVSNWSTACGSTTARNHRPKAAKSDASAEHALKFWHGEIIVSLRAMGRKGARAVGSEIHMTLFDVLFICGVSPSCCSRIITLFLSLSLFFLGYNLLIPGLLQNAHPHLRFIDT
jgi:hypothetical protein